MELLLQFVLLFLVVTHTAGTRLLDAHIQQKLPSGQTPGVGHMSLQHSLSSGQSPGVGHMSIQNVHIKGILSSGQTPAVGHMTLQSSHGEEVGHMGVPNAQIEEVLPSGGSPGVGHMAIHDAHMMLSSGQVDSEKKLSRMNKLPSGPSPAVGHVVIHSQKSADQKPAESHIPGPEEDNSRELGHVMMGSRETTKPADHVTWAAVREASVTQEEEVPAGKRHSKEEAVEVGPMDTSLRAGERPEKAGDSLVDKKDGGIIGCADVGPGSGSNHLFDAGTYYGPPSSLFFPTQS